LDTSVLAMAEEKINSYKQVCNNATVPDLFGNNDWRLKEFSNPTAHIKIATLFSGIGAIESAFKRLDLNHSITFAGDIDPHVKKSYYANYEIADSDWHDDVTKFDAKNYK